MEHVEELRPYLFGIAYRMLGSRRRRGRRPGDVPSLPGGRNRRRVAEAYLAKITTRLAIDQLRSARSRREVYPGEWLPEPLVGDETAGHAETADFLSLAFLHLLERLSPVERAVFLLREVFDYPYDEVGSIVGKTPENCRQILVRSHRHIRRGGADSRSRERSARRLPIGSCPPGRRRHRVPPQHLRRTPPCTARRREGAVHSGAARGRGARREGADRLGAQGPWVRVDPPRGPGQRRSGRRLLGRGRRRAVGSRARDRRRSCHRCAVDPQSRQARPRTRR